MDIFKIRPFRARRPRTVQLQGRFVKLENDIDYLSSATSEWTVIIVRVPLSWTVTVTITSRKRRDTASQPEDYDVTYNSNDFEFASPSNSTEEWKHHLAHTERDHIFPGGWKLYESSVG